MAKVGIATVLEGDCMVMEVINHDQTWKSVTSHAQTLRSGLKNKLFFFFAFFVFVVVFFIFFFFLPTLKHFDM